MNEVKNSWTTAISEVADDEVLLRGYPISQVITQLSFSEAYFMVSTGRLPSAQEARLLEAVMCGVLDYGLQKPGTVVARTVISTNRSSINAIAAATLAGGEFTMDPAPTAEYLLAALQRIDTENESIDEFAEKLVAESLANKEIIPGIGHPVYRKTDPRSRALREVAEQVNLVGSALLMLEAIHRALITRPKFAEMPLNDVGMIAALLTDLGIEPLQMAGVPLISAVPGLVAHITEEVVEGPPLRGIPRAEGQYRGPARRDLPTEYLSRKVGLNDDR